MFHSPRHLMRHVSVVAQLHSTPVVFPRWLYAMVVCELSALLFQSEHGQMHYIHKIGWFSDRTGKQLD